jgi:hypothetical protein
MFDLFATMGIAAGVISVGAHLPYIAGVLHGKTKTNRATWLIWSVINLLILVSYAQAGATITLWVPLSYFVCSATIASLVWRQNETHRWNKLEYFAIALTTVSIPAWFIFERPLITLLINIFVDFLGFLPLAWSTYLAPERENQPAWILFFIGNAINLVIVQDWTVGIALYPAYTFMASGTILALTYRPSIKKSEVYNPVKNNSTQLS